MVGAPDGILERSVLAHQADGVFEVCVGRFAPFQRAPPKLTFAIAAAAKVCRKVTVSTSTLYDCQGRASQLLSTQQSKS